MAKRMTDSEKWKDTWFSSLTAEHQLFWFYLMDNCDHAGVWKKGFHLFRQQTGLALDEAKAIDAMEGRLICVRKDLFFIPKFIKFQYGILNPERNNAHRGVVKSLIYHSIPIEGLPEVEIIASDGSIVESALDEGLARGTGYGSGSGSGSISGNESKHKPPKKIISSYDITTKDIKF